VRIHWFHLMPYPALPEGFERDHRSVWVDVDPALFDPEVGHHAYHDYLDELEHADQLGFDGICVNEHHQNAYGLMPSPNLMAAALTRRTRDAKIVVMGNSVALYNPPTRVAEEMAMLDVLSGGRLVAGFPVGTPMDAVFCYGEPPATLRDKYREGVDLVLRAWQATEPFAFNGRYTQLRYVNPWPRPVQRPHPPVWIPGGGASVETWRWCVEHDFLYAYLSYYGFQSGKRSMAAYWETVESMGADLTPYRAGFLQFVAVADSDAHAEELYGRHAEYFYNRCLHWYPGFTSAPGYLSIESIRAGLQSQVSTLGDMKAALAGGLRWKDIVERGYVIAGSAESVTEQLREVAETLRVGHLMVLLQFGDMPKHRVFENTERFAAGVMPKLRDVFADHDDRWFPTQTMPERAEPAPVGDARGERR
jgi:alkanesulfonate monooxygenase SsuD/methylene tetrahydromethanopterin reductase-like flavin-dependent oxidoreductase (luciferase family)